MHRADVFAYGAFTLCGAPFQKLPLTFARHAPTVLQPRVMHCYILGLGSCAFARHYLRNHFCFLFLRVMRCFSSPGSPSDLCQNTAPACGGLPHSDIRGSGDICSSPRLFAACHVLLRLREPRHPSCALLSFPLTILRRKLFSKTLPRVLNPSLALGIAGRRSRLLRGLTFVRPLLRCRFFEFSCLLVVERFVQLLLPSCQCPLLFESDDAVSLRFRPWFSR